MGSSKVKFEFQITREQLVSLLIDDQDIQATLTDGSSLTLPGCDHFVSYPDYEKESEKALKYSFETSVEYHGRRNPAKVYLKTDDGQTFNGTINFDFFANNMNE